LLPLPTTPSRPRPPRCFPPHCRVPSPCPLYSVLWISRDRVNCANAGEAWLFDAEAAYPYEDHRHQPFVLGSESGHGARNRVLMLHSEDEARGGRGRESSRPWKVRSRSRHRWWSRHLSPSTIPSQCRSPRRLRDTRP
jgi:hypothetical protein